ncbi:uncharacterized protein LOC112020670 [Quercus suber]|uniref:uncharacterized protein LOC112020670 n=1 Tax=Quercus suber TaxID=58331 RepID=UPI000CE23DAC|nr:uncharacterized protein LOC112020670 [Quercus suber]
MIDANKSDFKRSIKDGVEFFSVGLNAKLPRAKSVVAVGWEKPPVGWAKLNSNGFALGNPRHVGRGSVIKDHNGKWLKGYTRSLGSTNSCMAKLWALRDGLLLAEEMGLNNLIIELDALSVVLLMNNNTINLTLEPLLNDCKNLVREIPNKQPPPVVERILTDDKASLCCNRLIIS